MVNRIQLKMSDDDDYMSSAFLNVKEDIRPGLAFSKGTKRKHEIEKKQLESKFKYHTKSRKQLEEENRNAGLQNALTADNKGFAMLQKMGYKPGMKLGPQRDNQSASTGLTEPIAVTLKTDRGGLGRENEIRNKIMIREQRKGEIKVWKEKERELLIADFRQRMKDKVLYKQVIGDLNKSRKVCQQLDAENDVSEPIRPWFWFVCENDDEEVQDEENLDGEDSKLDLDPEEQLNFILDYLRCKYNYCIWCGIKYEHEEDLLSNCPGSEKSDHDE